MSKKGKVTRSSEIDHQQPKMAAIEEEEVVGESAARLDDPDQVAHLNKLSSYFCFREVDGL